MAKKTIQVGLQFTADTNKAKASLEQLEKDLHRVATVTPELVPDSRVKNIERAQKASAQLAAALREAVNVDTGSLDLNKFQKSLARGNSSLHEVRKELTSIGPQGEKAFSSLAMAIAKTEIPLRRTNKLLEKTWETLANTARWQISSSVLQGFTSALSDAYRYAQDLNKSLNDIRIVTGYNSEYMEHFADQANKAAKSLSTSTNEYAKASLIYFQQGLSDDEVARRTAATIKMANVTGEAAADVSSYMTAVWNNFDDGTKSLEFYADAITALGAATASSSEEIATGLQKFSAVANTVGLSYEYATAALATVTAQTRESADTVGTAFKTIFARLESLSLGETLDDDTTLTKYSQALSAVGVNIKTASGELKDMDTILDELGSKWNGISKDQQIALAQTVAGMRQYNNFISLLDNYDTMKLNVDIAANAEGTLSEQQEIYAESWEAASKRVQAAAESIYEKLLNDDFFIDLLDGFEKLIGLADKFIDSIGGVRGVLAGLSTILFSVFNKQMAEGLNNLAYNIKGRLGINDLEAKEYKKQAMEELAISQEKKQGGFQSELDLAARNIAVDQAELTSKKIDVIEKATMAQKIYLEVLEKQLAVEQESYLQAVQAKDLANEEVTNTRVGFKELLKNKLGKDGGRKLDSRLNSYAKAYEAGDASKIQETSTELYNFLKDRGAQDQDIINLVDKYTAALKKAKTAAQEVDKTGEKTTKTVETLNKEFEKLANQPPPKKDFAENIVSIAQGVSALSMAASSVKGIVDTLNNTEMTFGEKLLSIFMSLATTIPSVLQGMKALSEVQWANMLTDAKSTFTKIAQTIATKAHTKALKEEREELDKNTNEQKDNNKESAKGVVANVAQAATENGGKNVAPEVPADGAAEAVPKLGEILKSGDFWKGLGKVVAKAGLIAAAVAIIAGTITLIVQEYQKAEKAASRAEDNAKALREEAERTRDAYKELSDTIKGFEESAKGLETLTKGTLEYREALRETNEQAIELIRNNASLSGKYQTINGQIIFDDGALEEIQEAKFNELAKKDAMAYGAEAYAIETRNKAQTVELARDVNSISGELGAWGMSVGTGAAGAGAGALAGLAIGGPVGAAIGAAIGAVVGKVGGVITAAVEGISSETEKNRIDEITEKAKQTDFATDDSFRTFLKNELKISDPILIDSLVKNREAIRDLSEEVRLETEQTQLLREQMADAANQDSQLWAGSIYRDAMSAAVASGWGQTMAGKEKNATNQVEGLRNIWSQKELNQMVADAMGVEFEKEVEGAIRFRDRGGADTMETFRDGKWVAEGGKNTWSREAKEDYVVKSLSTDLTEDEIASLRSEISEQVAEVMRTARISHDEALSLVTNYIQNDEKWDLSSLAPSALYNGQFTGTQFATAAEEARKSWENYLNTLSDSTENFIADKSGKVHDFLTGMSRETIASYAGVLETILQQGGPEAQKQFSSNIEKLLETYPSQAKEILNIVNTTEWNKGTQSAQEFIGKLYDIGIVAEQEDIKNLFANMNVSVLVRDLDTVRSNIKDISELASKITFGSAVSDEDYKALTKYNAELKKSFILTAEGYRYVGEESLGKIAADNNKTLLKDTLEQYEKARQGADYLSKSTFNGERIDWAAFASGNYELKDETALTRLLLNSDNGNAALEAVGYDISAIEKWYKEAISGNETARKQIQEAFAKLGELQTNNTAGAYDENKAYQIYASTLTSMEELNKAYLSGLLGAGEEAKHLYEVTKEYIEELDRANRKLLRDNLTEYYDYALTRLENKAFDAAKKIETLTQKMSNALKAEDDLRADLQKLAQMTESTYNEDATHEDNLKNITADMTGWSSEAIQLFNQISAGYRSLVNEVYETDKAMSETVIQHFEQIEEIYEDVNKQYENLTSTTEHFKNIIELTGKGALGDMTQQIKLMNKANMEGSQLNLKSAKATLDSLAAQKAALEEQYELIKGQGITDPEVLKNWDNTFKELDEKIADATENYYTSWEESIEAVVELFKEEITTAIEDFSKKMTGAAGITLDELKEKFDQQSVLSGQYVKDYEKIYKLTQLSRKIENDMNKPGSTKNKKALRDLQQEITKLQESGAEVSAHDLELLQKRYELQLAQAALEESQDAKKTVRLQRDASGSWSYVYTQNNEEIDKALTEYENKLYDVQKFNDDYLQETAGQIISVQSEYQQALEELALNQELSVEEKQAKMDELTKYYSQRLAYYTSEYDKTVEANAILYDEDWQYYADATNAKIENCHDFQINFNGSVLGTLETGYSSATKWYDNFVAQVGSKDVETSLLGKLNKANTDFQDNLTNTYSAAGEELNQFGGKIETTVGKTDQEGMRKALADAATAANEKLLTNEDSIAKSFEELKQKISNWWSDPANGVQKILNDYIALVEAAKAASEGGLEAFDTGNNGNNNISNDDFTKFLNKMDMTQARDFAASLNLQYSTIKNGQKVSTKITKDMDMSKAENINAVTGAISQYVRSKDSEGNLVIDGQRYNGVISGIGLRPKTPEGPEGDNIERENKYNIITTVTDPLTQKIMIQMKDDKKWYYLSDILSLGGYMAGNQVIGLTEITRKKLNDIPESITKYKKINYGTALEEAGQIGRLALAQYKPIKGHNWNGKRYIWFSELGQDYWFLKDSLLAAGLPVDAYNTGGYTGTWGPEGRLAMLHQKEIVLNPDDTSNLLASVSLIRDITKQIDLQAAAAASGLGSLQVRGIGSGASTLQQEVVIHAEFPNATDRYEIEEAFNTLINRASQYTNRK